MKYIQILLLSTLILIPTKIYGQIITEILINYPYERDTCQYIEIFNNTQNTLDLRQYSISVQGYEIKITNLFLEDFETEGITNSYLLEPNQFAVILPYSYTYSSKPFYFPPNTLILISSTKYLGKTIPLNKDILQTITLLSNQIPIDYVSTTSLPESTISFERNGNTFIPSQTPSFGFTNKPTRIYFSKQIYKPNETVEIFLEVPTNSDYIEVEILNKGKINLKRLSSNTYKGSFNINRNGERIIAKYNNLITTTRILDLFELSENFENILINEINFSPQKSWFNYFLGGNINQKPSESDKYIELVNLSQANIPISNLYLHCIQNDKEIILKLKDYIIYSSKRGIITNTTEIEPEEYVIFSTPNLTSNMVFMLKDHHPYKGGKILHFAEESGLNIIPFSHSNKFINKGYPSVSLLPNAFPNKLGGKFLNWNETPARYNGFRDPSIVVDSKYKKIPSDLEIYIIDEILEPTKTIKIYSKESKIVRTLEITNQGFWYYGKYKISTNPLNPIYVKELDEITIEYSKNFQNFSETITILPSNFSEISSAKEPFLERSIIKPRETIRILNTKKHDTITFFTKEGNFIKTIKVDKNDIYEIDSSFLGKNGIFIIQLERNNLRQIFKLLIVDQ